MAAVKATVITITIIRAVTTAAIASTPEYSVTKAAIYYGTSSIRDDSYND